MQRKEYRSSDEHAWTFVYAGAQRTPAWHMLLVADQFVVVRRRHLHCCNQICAPSAAPEMLMGRACTEKSDIYSFGVCLWELVMRQVQLWSCGRSAHDAAILQIAEIAAVGLSPCLYAYLSRADVSTSVAAAERRPFEVGHTGPRRRRTAQKSSQTLSARCVRWL